METITRKVYLCAWHFSHHKPGEFSWSVMDWKPDHGTQMLGCWERTVTLELPADFEPHAAQVAALQAQREKAAQDFAARVKEIDAALSKLQAIGNEVPA